MMRDFCTPCELVIMHFCVVLLIGALLPNLSSLSKLYIPLRVGYPLLLRPLSLGEIECVGASTILDNIIPEKKIEEDIKIYLHS